MENRDIIIVNDSKFEARILMDILSRLGMNPILSDEYTILRDIKHRKPFMVIINYILEDCTGDRIIEELKKRSPNTICILSSSNTLSITDFPSSPIDQIIKTPITIDKMKEIFLEKLEKENSQCSKCGKAIQKDFIVCPYCGTLLKIRA